MMYSERFWSSAVLTGNRTAIIELSVGQVFWSSAVLTGNRTGHIWASSPGRFGAVPF